MKPLEALALMLNQLTPPVGDAALDFGRKLFTATFYGRSWWVSRQ